MVPIEVEVTEAPQGIAALLGRTADPFSTGWAFQGRVQNRGPATVYRAGGSSAPDPAAVRGFRHGVGSSVLLDVWGEPAGAEWVWTAGGSGTATLVFEDLP